MSRNPQKGPSSPTLRTGSLEANSDPFDTMDTSGASPQLDLPQSRRATAELAHDVGYMPSSPTDPLSQGEITRRNRPSALPHIEAQAEPQAEPPTQPQTRENIFTFQRKRGPTTPQHTIRPRPFTLGERTAKTCLLEARELILEASTRASSFEEQTKLLDLLEVFRQYTEKGQIKTISSILASQISNLETATRKIEGNARTLAKVAPVIPMARVTAPPTQNQGQKKTIAQIAALSTQQGQNNQARPAYPRTYPRESLGHEHTVQEWTTVGKKTKTGPPPASPSTKPANKSKIDSAKRLILVGVKDPILSPEFSALSLRNRLNSAFAAKGIKDPVVNLITKSWTTGGNLVITTTQGYSAQFLLDKIAIVQSVITFEKATAEETWYKVILHGIPTRDFNNEAGMDMILQEIKTFNEGYNPVGTPFWLTAKDKRASQYKGSVVVAFKTEAEATKAIRNRLYIAGISVRVDKLYSTAKSTQCTKCQGYGHLPSYCKKKPICRLCSEVHATSQHKCNTCQSSQSCIHLTPKCINCKGAHIASSKSCEVYLAIKNKDTIMMN